MILARRGDGEAVPVDGAIFSPSPPQWFYDISHAIPNNIIELYQVKGSGLSTPSGGGGDGVDIIEIDVSNGGR